MKYSLLLFLFCISPYFLFPQLNEQDQTLNASSLQIPDTATYSTAAIANYLYANSKTIYEKIHTLYDWVTGHISYGTDSIYYYNWANTNEAIADVTLRRRKGVCENFASLFTNLLLKTGIPSFVVNGYTRLSGRVTFEGHSWTAVQANNIWLLCDPTWDAGDGNSNKWLMMTPDDFISTHMPFDPMWQLMDHPLSHKEFRQGKRSSRKGSDYFNYPDSIRIFLQMDSLQQLEGFTRRMYQAGLENSRLQTWHSYNEMKIAIIYGDKDMERYNAAVACLNQASTIFNGFVQYRNNQFRPIRPDADIATLLDPISGLINSARQHINQMGQVVENFQYDTGALKERLDALAVRLRGQKAFIDRYLATGVGEREKLFLE